MSEELNNAQPGEPQSTTVVKPFLNIQEAAKYIGLGYNSVRRLIESGKLTALRPVPGRVLLSREEIDNMVRTSGGGRVKRRANAG